MEWIRGWVREMEVSEGVFKWELGMVRRDVGESMLVMVKLSRELEDYSVSMVLYLGSKGLLSI